MGIILKVILFAMLQDKKSVFFQHIVFENQIRDCFQFFQFIRRVGKNKVELLMTAINEFEYISTYRQAFIRLHFLHDFTDKSMMGTIFLYTDDTVATARHQFNADAACTGKEVKGNNAVFEVPVVG